MNPQFEEDTSSAHEKLQLLMLFDNMSKKAHGIPVEITIKPIHSPTREFQRYRETERYDGMLHIKPTGEFYVTYRRDWPAHDWQKTPAYANGIIPPHGWNSLISAKRTWTLKPTADTKS